MIKKLHIMGVGILVLGFLTLAMLRFVRANDAVEGPGGLPYPNDAGPSQVDISSYPAVTQADYRVFARRCSQCHSLARALNSQYLQLTPEELKEIEAKEPDILADKLIWQVSDSEWAGVIVKMHAKPGAAIRIHPAELDKVIEFLVYDAKVRKMGPNREAWRAQRQKLLVDFKKTHPERYAQLFEANP